MKPVYLEFCGINSFSEKAEIDFRALLSGGVFGIFGDTGSGKSTILDCINLALYNDIDRGTQATDCLNYKTDKAYVIFDFEILWKGERHTYRVHRERRRNGTSKASLYEYQADKLQAIAEGTRDVNAKLLEIIGLEFSDFKMSIALPQGDFAALVKATPAERVKLVSRLFDLDKYGEKLQAAVKARYEKADNEVNLLRAEMGQNEGGRDAFIEEKQKEIEAGKAAMALLKEEERRAEARYEKAAALAKEKAQYDEICKTLASLESRLTEMTEKRAEIERLPLARAVIEKSDALQKSRLSKETALVAQERSNGNAEKESARLNELRAKCEKENYDDGILKLSMDLEKVRGAQADIDAAEKAQSQLQRCRAEYAELAKKCEKDDFAENKAKLESELAELGQDDTFSEYVKHHFQDALLSDAYAEMRQDLRDLAEKYPQTQADIDVLLRKYAESHDGAEWDIVNAQNAFKQAEARKKSIKAAIDQIDKEKLEYDKNKAMMDLLLEQGQEYRRAYDAAQEKIAFVANLGTSKEIEIRLTALKNEKAALQREIDLSQKNLQEFRTEAERQKGLAEAHAAMEKSLQEELRLCLERNGFSDVAAAQVLAKRIGDETAANESCKRFFESYELYKHKRAEIDERKFLAYMPTEYDEAAKYRIEVRSKMDEATRALAAAETELARLFALREKYREFEKRLAVKEKEKKLCDELRALISRNKLLEFIASEYLQEICVTASARLLKLTNGRFFLRYEKEFKVGDNLDGGNLRAVKTLSGGETFLVSLSLALALSGAICQRSLRPIEFFFLDEGFGTLDKRLVETVMDVLGKLSKDFSIGLISHVEELKHRIDYKILVTGANEEHGSQVKLVRF